ncbi:MAG: hypothetical protein Kow0059_00130 [Candidatus Sumerlaeia bacterium]
MTITYRRVVLAAALVTGMLAIGRAQEIIVDNPAAAVSGPWTLASTLGGKYGADYRIKAGTSGGTNTVVFTPNLPLTGQYWVFEQHPQDAGNTTVAEYIVAHAGGTATVNVNQQTGGGTWNSVGIFNFNAGTGHSVTITDKDALGRNVIADAVRFLYLGGSATPTPTPTVTPTPTPNALDFIIDNPEAFPTGAWSSQTAIAGRYGADYLTKAAGDGSAFVEYRPNFVQTGRWYVMEWHPADAANATDVPHEIDFGNGFKSTEYIDQSLSGGTWNGVGVYNFYAGTNQKIRIKDGATGGGNVIADALRFQYIGPTYTPTPTPTVTPTPSATPIVTATPTPTATGTPTPTPTASATPTVTPTATPTPQPGEVTPTPTATATPTVTPTISPTPTVTPTPSPTPKEGEVTPTPTATPTPSPTPKAPDEPDTMETPIPPDQTPRPVTRTNAWGPIRDIEFNEANEHVYVFARVGATAQDMGICWVSYDDIKQGAAETPMNSTRTGGTYMYASHSGDVRYLGINQMDNQAPWVKFFRCEPKGAPNAGTPTGLNHRVVNDAMLRENYTVYLVGATRRGCVSPSPPSLYLPIDVSIEYWDFYPNVPYSLDSRLMCFLNGEANSLFEKTPICFELANPLHVYKEIYPNKVNIGDTYFGWGKVLVPFETDPGVLLMATPDPKTGFIPYLSPFFTQRVGGLQQAYFVDYFTKQEVPIHFRYAQVVFHPTAPVAFIIDSWDSGVGVIDLAQPAGNKNNWFKGIKFTHPRRAAGGQDNSRKIAISGDGQYVATCAPGAVYCWSVERDVLSDEWILKPVSVFQPAGVTFNTTLNFALGWHDAIYVSDGARILYSLIEDDPNAVITEAEEIIDPGDGFSAGALYADPERTLLAANCSKTITDRRVFFYKIGNWNYNVRFTNPKISLKEGVPLLPLNAPADVEVIITDKKTGAPVTGGVVVELSYDITDDQNVVHSFGPVPMAYTGSPGVFRTQITATVPGSFQMRADAAPQSQPTVKDSALLTGLVRENDDPFISVTYMGPAHVIIPNRLDRPYECRLEGKVTWAAAHDPLEWTDKWVRAREIHTGAEQRMELDGDGASSTFILPFSLNELPTDTPLVFNLLAHAEKPLGGGNALVHESVPEDFQLADPTCVISTTRLATSIMGPVLALPGYVAKTLYDRLHYEWSFRLPPDPNLKLQWEFNGQDYTIGDEFTIPLLEDISFKIATFVELVGELSSWAGEVEKGVGKGEGSFEFTIPIGVGLVGGGGGVTPEVTTGLKPDCYWVAVPAEQAIIQFAGLVKVSFQTSALNFAKKIKADFILKLLNFSWGKKLLEKIIKVQAGVEYEPSVKGQFFEDPNAWLGFTMTNSEGELKTSLTAEGSGSIAGKIDLALASKLTLVQDASDWVVPPVPSSMQLLMPVKAGALQVTATVKSTIACLAYERPFTLIQWQYPPSAAAGAAPAAAVERVGDWTHTPQLPPFAYTVMPGTSGAGSETALHAAAGQVLVDDCLPFAAPRQAVRGNKRMIVYVKGESGLPQEQSTEISYLYYENDVLTASGDITDDTRFQDAPQVIFASDTTVLMACQSMNLDDFTHSSTDLEVMIADAAPHQEIAWAAFDTTTKTWTPLQYLTSNNDPDYSPRLIINHEGKPMLFFQTMSGADLFPSAAHIEMLKSSVYEGASFGSPQTILGGIQSLITYDVRGFSGKTLLVFERDSDDNENTTNDTHLFQLTYEGSPAVWTTSFVSLTSGESMNHAPRLLDAGGGQPRLIWQRNNEAVSSVGEPLGANPQVILDGLSDAAVFNTDYEGLMNGDFLAYTNRTASLMTENGSVEAPDYYYQYIETGQGSAGWTALTSDPDSEFHFTLTALPNGLVSALFVRNELIEDENGAPTWGKASIVLLDFEPDPDVSVQFAVNAPQSADRGQTAGVTITAERTIKIYSADFQVDVPAGLTIQSVTPAAGLTQAIAPGGRRAFIRRSGAAPVVEIPLGTPLATLTVSVDADAAAGVPHTIALRDEDGGFDYMTTNEINVNFPEATADIVVGSSGISWFMR